MFTLLYDIFFSNSINIVVNCFNAILLILGVVFLVKAFVFLRRGRRELRAVEAHFKESPHPITQKNVERELADLKLSDKGMLGEAIEILQDLAKSSLEDRDKIMYFEEIRNEIRTAVPRAIPALAVIIGFLGTVLGLFISIERMPDIFNATNLASDAAIKELVDTMVFSLNGMSIAFGTTLVGLCVSLLLTLGNVFYKMSWAPYDHKFHKFLTLKLYPLFMAPDDENIISHLLRAINELRETATTIERSNSRLLTSVNSLSDNMKDYNTENRKVLTNVSRAVNAFLESQQGNKDLFEAIKEMVQQANESYHRVSVLLDTSEQDRSAFLGYVQDSRDEIKEICTLQHQAYEKTNAAHLKNQQQHAEDVLQHFNEVQNELLTDQKRANEVQHEEFVKAHLGFQKTFTRLQDELINSIAQDNKSRLDAFTEQSEKVQSGLQDHIESISEETQQLLENISETTQKHLEDMDEKATDFLKKHHKDYSENIAGIRSVLGDFKDQVTKSDKQHKAETVKLIQQLSGLIQKTIETNNYYITGVN